MLFKENFQQAFAHCSAEAKQMEFFLFCQNADFCILIKIEAWRREHIDRMRMRLSHAQRFGELDKAIGTVVM